MAADAILTARVDELIAGFNRRSMDLPDGLFDRRTRFLLNGTAFEETLGRSPDDPLVLMIARGPAGYRFIVKALQHALPDARVERGAFEALDPPMAEAVALPLWLSGTLRGSGGRLETVVRATVGMGGAGVIRQVDVAVEPATAARLREARLHA